MERKEELKVHVCFFLLFLVSHYLDPLMLQVLPAWRPPQVSFWALVIGLLWLGTFALQRFRTISDRFRVMQDRIERLERRCRTLEDERVEH